MILPAVAVALRHLPVLPKILLDAEAFLIAATRSGSTDRGEPVPLEVLDVEVIVVIKNGEAHHRVGGDVLLPSVGVMHRLDNVHVSRTGAGAGTRQLERPCTHVLDKRGEPECRPPIVLIEVEFGERQHHKVGKQGVRRDRVHSRIYRYRSR